MTEAQKATWLVSFSHCITHGFMTLLPAVLVAISAEHSMSFLDIGIIANIGYFLYGLGSFPAGYLADRYGAKRILSAGVLGMAASSLLVGLSPGAAGFAVTYAMLGIFASIHHPAGLALIARRVTEKKGKALGLHGVFGNIGLFLTPLMASGCVLFFGTWRAAYIIYGLAGVVFFAVLQRTRLADEPNLSFAAFSRRSPAAKEMETAVPPEEKQQQKVPAEAILPLALLVLFAGSILSGFIFRGSLTFFPVLLQREVLFVANQDEPVVIAGFITTAVLSLGLIGSWFGGYLNDKLKHPELFPVVIFAISGPALYFLGRFTDNKLLAAGCLFSLVYYAWQPAQNYLIAKYTKKSSHGKGFGVNFFLIFGMGSVATATGGYFIDNYSVDYFYTFMSIIAAAALVASALVPLARSYQLRYVVRLEKEKV